MERRHGLNIVNAEAEEDYGLPKVLTEDTLESLQYMYVFVSSPLFSFSLMLAVGTFASACRPHLAS